MAHGMAVLLLSSAAGYWVLERAASHKGNLKTVGQLVGGAIIAVSLAGVACKVWYVAKCSRDMGGFCPYMSKPAPETSKK